MGVAPSAVPLRGVCRSGLPGVASRVVLHDGRCPGIPRQQLACGVLAGCRGGDGLSNRGGRLQPLRRLTFRRLVQRQYTDLDLALESRRSHTGIFQVELNSRSPVLAALRGRDIEG